MVLPEYCQSSVSSLPIYQSHTFIKIIWFQVIWLAGIGISQETRASIFGEGEHPYFEDGGRKFYRKVGTYCQNMWCQIPENRILRIQLRENIKSHSYKDRFIAAFTDCLSSYLLTHSCISAICCVLSSRICFTMSHFPFQAKTTTFS